MPSNMANAVQRAYKACEYCKHRKSKCEFDLSEPTWPARNKQCRRCHREGRHCVIPPSQGVRDKQRSRTRRRTPSERMPSQSLSSGADSASDPSLAPLQLDGLHMQSALTPENRDDLSYENDSAICTSSPSTKQGEVPASSPLTEGSSTENTIANGQLQNPGDALQLLARVASTDLQMSRSDQGAEPFEMSQASSTETGSLLHVLNISTALAHELLLCYKKNYHPFFPIANERILRSTEVELSAQREPFLLLVLLTIASKQDEKYTEVHRLFSDYLQTRIANLVSFAPVSVEAVEALLLLAEWTPQRFQTQTNVGCGEEDRAAWMHVGLAVRLAYLQELDSTSFSTWSKEESQASQRRRVAWAACFMSDRQISVRVGKAFWSRGPGPLSTRAFEDYEPFIRQSGDLDDHSSIFKANLGLTQLLSNAHDILYASGSHRDRLFRTGEYAKYIDDFRTSLANWQDRWGSLSCSPNTKSSLILSYEYLRLYITAFAYQATLSRETLQTRSQFSRIGQEDTLAKRLAGTADARFIYEAVNAAKTLLSTFNSFVDPVTCLRYMPIKYYLYVIYAAVFLHKAGATGILGDAPTKDLGNMIRQTIERLQQSSTNPQDIGCRYSNLLALLWKRSPRKGSNAGTTTRKSFHESQTASRNDKVPAFDQPSLRSSRASCSSVMSDPQQVGGPLPTNDMAVFQDDNLGEFSAQGLFPSDADISFSSLFSWTDLEAIGQFATTANATLVDGRAQLTSSPEDAFSAAASTDTNMNLDLWGTNAAADEPTVSFAYT